MSRIVNSKLVTICDWFCAPECSKTQFATSKFADVPVNVPLNITLNVPLDFAWRLPHELYKSIRFDA